MAINDKDIARFLAGEMRPDDPAWAGVVAFLQRLDAVYPVTNTTVLEAGHLDAVIAEARHLHLATALEANPEAAPAAPPRLAMIGLAGAVLALTVGVGAAAAVNGQLVGVSAPDEVGVPVARTVAAPKPSDHPAAQEKAEVASADSAEHTAAARTEPAPRPHHRAEAAPRVEPKPRPQPAEEAEPGEHESDHEDVDEPEDHGDHADEPGEPDDGH